MSSIRFYTDEDVSVRVAEQLRRHGIDAITTGDEGNLGAKDDFQLEWATRADRVVFTHNVQDFAKLHYECLSQQRHHAGIVVSAQLGVGQIVRRLRSIAAAFDGKGMHDRLEYLSNWPAA